MVASPQIRKCPGQSAATPSGSGLPPVAAVPLDPLNGIPAALVARAEAKAEILAAFRVSKNHSSRTLNATLESFAALYSCGQIEVSASTRDLYPETSAASLQRDWRRFQKFGIAGIVPGYKGSKGLIRCNLAMNEFVIASIGHNPSVRAPFVLAGLKTRFPKERIPDLRSVERFIRGWKKDNLSLHLRIKDPDGWRNSHMLALGDMEAGITRVGQLWEIDGTPADSYVLGTVDTPGGRLHLLAAVDVCSRKFVTLLVPTESSDGLARLFAKAIPVLGVPAAIRHDNGAGFISARTQRALVRLGITSIATPAYRGDRKGFIERGIGTILHSFFENVPGYIGHSVVEASQIRKRHSFAQRRGERRNMRKLYRIELTAPELQKLLDDWLDHVYGNRKHSGLGGETPNETFLAGERRGEVRRLADDRLLDLLLGEDGIGTVSKKGLRVAKAFYWNDALAEHVDRNVQYVRTRDQGRVIVYSADAAPRFICIAVDPESQGIDREVISLAAKQRQNAVMREGLRELDVLKRKHRPDTVYREIIDNAVARAAVQLPVSEAGAEIVSLPYRSAALTAAAAALEALEKPVELEPHDEETLREGAAALAAIEQRRAAREADLSDDELWTLWIAVRRTGRELNERERAFLSRFGNTSESWAISYETSSAYQAGLFLEKCCRRDVEGDGPCERKSA